MLTMLSRHWWYFLVRGLAAVVFGVLAVGWPGVALMTLVIVFGVFALIDGIFAAAAGIAAVGAESRWWALLLAGLAGIAVGVLTFLWPHMTGLVLLYVIAAWAVATGVFEIAAAIRLRRAITGEWLVAFYGVLSIFIGTVLFAFPGDGAIGLAWLIGVYALVIGVLQIILSVRLRGLKKEIEKTAV